LQVDQVTAPGTARAGEPIHLEWTVSNHGTFAAGGNWTDVVYLSEDAVWDVGDRAVGRVGRSGTLAPGQSYTAQLDALMPAAKPGQSRFIVRTDVFDEVFEGADEANNRTASPGVVTVTAPELHLGVPLDSTLNAGQERLFQVTVGLGQTLQVELTTPAADASNEIYIG